VTVTPVISNQAQQWAFGLDEVAQRIGARFARAEPRQRALAYVQGLLSPIERKNGWQLAEHAGDEAPYGVQHLLGRATWSADEVRDDLRTYVVEHLGDPDAVLIVDETGFLKKGEQSVGVQRQYSGTAGRIENCQVGVFLAYHAPRGRTLLDRALYVPRAWTEDAARCVAAGGPTKVKFATKPRLAEQMLKRALEAGVPARWVTGDAVYGSDSAFRHFLEKRKMAYVLGVTSDDTIRPYTTGALAESLPKKAWRRLSAGDGSKGPRWYDWALHTINPNLQGWGHWLLIRQHVDKPEERAYFRVSAPAGTSLKEMVAVAGKRWAVEECFAMAKGECGLDEYEVRSWVGWHRHVTLSLLAHAYLTVVRAQAVETEPPQKERGRTAERRVDSADGARGTSAAVAARVARSAGRGVRAELVALATAAPSDRPALSLPQALPGTLRQLQL
jgi:SRSO17 transposase